METLQRLDGYSLTRDDLVECLNGAPFQDKKSRFEAIPSKTRASFTRKYNSTIHQQTNIFAKVVGCVLKYNGGNYVKPYQIMSNNFKSFYV